MTARYATQNLNITLTNFGLEAHRAGGPSIVDMVAPTVPVGLTDTKYYVFNNAQEDISNFHDAKRAPKAVSTEISRSYTSATLSLDQYGLRELVADEEMDNADMTVINPENDATRLVLRKHDLIKESALNAVLFDSGTTFASYTAAAAAYWDAGTTYIEKDIDAGKEKVLKSSGVEANTIVIPYTIAMNAKRSSEIRDLVKYTDPTLLVNGLLPPMLWGLKVVIPTSLNNEADPGVSTVSADFLHDDKSVWLGYVERAVPSKRSMSCFYTFTRPLAGVAGVAVYRYRDDARHGNWIDGLSEWAIKCVAPQCGYVITAADA